MGTVLRALGVGVGGKNDGSNWFEPSQWALGLVRSAVTATSEFRLPTDLGWYEPTQRAPLSHHEASAIAAGLKASIAAAETSLRERQELWDIDAPFRSADGGRNEMTTQGLGDLTSTEWRRPGARFVPPRNRGWTPKAGHICGRK